MNSIIFLCGSRCLACEHSLAGHVQPENIPGTQYSKIKKPKTSTVRAFLCADSKGGGPPTLQGWTACSDQLSCLALSCAACCAAHASIYRKDTAVWQALFCRLRRGHSHETLSLRRDEAPTPQRAEIAATIPDRPALACRRSCCVREVSALSPGCALRRSCCRWRPRVTCPAAKRRSPGTSRASIIFW